MQRHNVMSEVCDINDIINPHATANEKKLNTLLRQINTVFSSTFINDFVHLNDAKRRKDFEEAHGGSPVKAFWREVSEHHNDTTNNAELGLMAYSMEDEDKHSFDLQETETVDLRNCDQLNQKSAQQNMSDMFKCRAKIQVAMKASGHHCDDMWSHLRKTFLAPQAGASVVPGAAACYLDLMCSKNQSIDTAFCEALSDEQRADSDIGFKDGDSADKRSGKGKSDFLEALNDINVRMENATTTTASQRQAFLTLSKTKASQEQMSRLWSEHQELSLTAENLRNRFECGAMLRNVAMRIRAIESELGVPESVANDIRPVDDISR